MSQGLKYHIDLVFCIDVRSEKNIVSISLKLVYLFLVGSDSSIIPGGLNI